MRALLDTNSFLWFISGSDRLSSDAKTFIADMRNQLVLSAASLWEIAIKISLGKLDLLQPSGQLIPQQLEENDIAVLPLEIGHLNKVIDLPFHHRDPFARLIIAQALAEGIHVVSSDAVFSQYAVKLIL
ncbi:MAG: twitching motility protein PilT [Deltaproteobacteria bacterium RBG_16_58_17]|nr:MAG: twitching motility protein PilT [Deltaproteobacteria bacterium RBG_16_58_17]